MARSRLARPAFWTTRWRDLVPWTHSWDSADAVTYNYAYDEVNWPLAIAGARVSSVPNPQSPTFPAVKDDGTYGIIFFQIANPGPLWFPSHAYFGGRPCWFTDTTSLGQGFFDNYHSMLAPQMPRGQNKFNQSQPFWGAILVRSNPGNNGGNDQAWWDGSPGSITLTPISNTVNNQCWNSSFGTGPSITTSAGSYALNRTYLVIFYESGVNGTSWLDITYRDDSGVLQNERVTGTQGGQSTPMDDIHWGWSHTNYCSASGLVYGSPTAGQVSALQTWAAHWIPTAG